MCTFTTHTFFGLCLFCVGTHEHSSTSQSHELTKRALENNDDVGSRGFSFPPLSSRISSTWLSHGYGLLSITYSVPILPCSLCMICSFLCLCNAFVTHALHYTWWLILLRACVFASLVEILLVIALFQLCHIPMMISCFAIVFVICHVHCLCLLFAHMTWLPWFPLVCCIFAPLVCTAWFLCLLMVHPILVLLDPITYLVATMSFLHICHVPLIATCLPWFPHTWWTIALSIVLSATWFSLHPMHIMLGLSCTCMCLVISCSWVLWMTLMPTIDHSLRVLCMLAMILR